jgi:hypothetical protein
MKRLGFPSLYILCTLKNHSPSTLTSSFGDHHDVRRLTEHRTQFADITRLVHRRVAGIVQQVDQRLAAGIAAAAFPGNMFEVSARGTRESGRACDDAGSSPAPAQLVSGDIVSYGYARD